ncbi:hypothetical protein POM88_053413 [Heracleum sosnowskyi]|uniref:SAM-dependent methyltransferase TRM5/TYW2-type domain-containing protein n=1 Tax=Heracleum sosnowskyi TaxID=360622 RepID=A0AAD8LY50_9APIA|nr:hypothetical protein POM88_053413 [Heracleum sosnowskyi]
MIITLYNVTVSAALPPLSSTPGSGFSTPHNIDIGSSLPPISSSLPNPFGDLAPPESADQAPSESVTPILEALLPEGLIVPSAFETVGHIAHLNLRDEHQAYKKLIAKVVLDKNKPKIQTVVNKTDAIHNDYRTMQLEVLAGNHSLVTTVVENGLRFQVDLGTVYWNSRLATERQRLLNCFTQDDIICKFVFQTSLSELLDIITYYLKNTV